MNGVFETERSVEFLGLDQIGNRKTNIPQNPHPASRSLPPSTPGLLASGAVQPVWDNVTVYSRSGPHTLAEGVRARRRRRLWWMVGREAVGGISATVTLGQKKGETVKD